MQYGAFNPSFTLHGTLATDNALRFCFAPDISRPLLELEQRFFNKQHGGNGKIA